jgi:hypothetical protein
VLEFSFHALSHVLQILLRILRGFALFFATRFGRYNLTGFSLDRLSKAQNDGNGSNYASSQASLAAHVQTSLADYRFAIDHRTAWAVNIS